MLYSILCAAVVIFLAVVIYKMVQAAGIKHPEEEKPYQPPSDPSLRVPDVPSVDPNSPEGKALARSAGAPQD